MGAKLAIVAPHQKVMDILCRAGADKKIKIFRSIDELHTISQTFTKEEFSEENVSGLKQKKFDPLDKLNEISNETLINEISVKTSLEEKQNVAPNTDNKIKFSHIDGDILPFEEDINTQEEIGDKELENLKKAFRRKHRRKSGSPKFIIIIIFIALASFSGAVFTGFISTSELIGFISKILPYKSETDETPLEETEEYTQENGFSI